jgi:hypothetical protein
LAQNPIKLNFPQKIQKSTQKINKFSKHKNPLLLKCSQTSKKQKPKRMKSKGRNAKTFVGRAAKAPPQKHFGMRKTEIVEEQDT